MCVALGKDVFSVPGAEGQVGAYVNPDGYVHQVSDVVSLHAGVHDLIYLSLRILLPSVHCLVSPMSCSRIALPVFQKVFAR